MCVEVRRMGCHGEWERVLLVVVGGGVEKMLLVGGTRVDGCLHCFSES